MSTTETIRYDDALVRRFLAATLVWGAVGMLVGLWCALELAMPSLNIAPYFTFGRLRPLHDLPFRVSRRGPRTQLDIREVALVESDERSAQLSCPTGQQKQ